MYKGFVSCLTDGHLGASGGEVLDSSGNLVGIPVGGSAIVASFLHRLDKRQNYLRRPQMTRSLYAIPATLCLAAAVVTAQAPAGDKPASNPPATQQPAGQPPAGQQPSTRPGPRPLHRRRSNHRRRWLGTRSRTSAASSRARQPERGFSRMLKPRRLGQPAPARSERLADPR